jgi:hypothetical protein
MNCVELETPKGRTNCAINLLSKTKLTVCGSLTIDRLYQLTLVPTLICMENVVKFVENVVNRQKYPLLLLVL